jgi:hypothetical protein
MSASAYEYKTVALPQTVEGKRRRGQSEADQVAMALGEIIHEETTDGWEYMRSDILAARGRSGFFSREVPVNTYTVLIFRRMAEGVWPLEQPHGAPAQQAAAAPPPPPPPPAPVTPPEPVPPIVDDPTSPLSQGSFVTPGGQFRADGSVPTAPKRPRPPLGSAQD